MTPIRSILHPTDFSPAAVQAFQIACSLARNHRARVHVLHVLRRPIIIQSGVMTPPPVPSNTRELNEAYEKIRDLKAPGVSLNHQIEEGDPAATILKVASELACDLIVLGTHGRTGLARLFMGSTAEKVLREACCPVLTVKAKVIAEPLNELTTDYELNDPIQAEMIKNALSDENIPCWLEGIEQGSTVRLPGTSIRVQVPSAVAKKARQYIERWETRC